MADLYLARRPATPVRAPVFLNLDVTGGGKMIIPLAVRVGRAARYGKPELFGVNASAVYAQLAKLASADC